MAFIESPVFPLRVSFHPLFGPEFMTDVVMTEGGQEYRNQVNEQPLQRAEVSFNAGKPAEIATFRKFFYIAAGRNNGFRVRDASDFQCPDDNGTGVLQLIGSSTYQIYKRYELGSSQFDRKIVKPEVGTFAMYDVTTSGRTLKLLTVHYTIDESTGRATINFTPDGDLQWEGRFHVPMRFDIDAAQMEILDKNPQGLYIQGWQSIPLVEIRNP